VTREWEKTRIQILKLSKKGIVIAKKGEKEIIKLSRKSKLHIDTTALGLKKERLYYMIGKEYANTKSKDRTSVKLTKLVTELNKTNKQQDTLRRKLKVTKKQVE